MLAAGVFGAAPLAAQQPSPALDVLHYDLSVDLPDTGSHISARAELTVARRAASDSLILDLIGLTVDSVSVNGAAVRAGRDSATIRIPLPNGSRDTLHVAVAYSGVPSDGLIIRTDSTGRWTAFGDNWPKRARYWIPSVDAPSDKATVTWTVRAPAERTVVANGVLVEETPIAPDASGHPRTLTRWSESEPIPTYLMVIAAAQMAYYNLGETACGHAALGGCVHQMVYMSPATLDWMPGPFAQSPGIVAFFSTLVAPFPFERLAHLQSSTRFGGMENATAIFYADRSFTRHTLSVNTVAHETAHQWFGDAVTESDFADLWLSEGFATYFAELWTQKSQGDSAFRVGMARIRTQIVKSPVSAERPVHDSIETNTLKLLNTNSYQKGGFTLHMLRGLLGDSAFFRGVRSYWLAHRYGNARTQDLEAALEKSSGRNLRWFFDQWIRRPGFPELTTSWRYDKGTHRVTLDVEQGTRFGAFRFPLAVEVRDAGGRPHRVTVQVRAAHSQRIVLPVSLDAAPRALVFDPDVQLLATFAEQ